MYAYLSAFVTLLVMAIGLIQVVIHFTLKVSFLYHPFIIHWSHFGPFLCKDEIINTCTNFNEGDTVFYVGVYPPNLVAKS